LSVFSFLAPLFGAVAGYLMMIHALTPVFGVVAAVVIAGLYRVDRQTRRPRPPLIHC
jgi:hypothetical protein